MTDQQPNSSDQPTPDETFTWSSSDTPHGESAGGSATAILESIRDAVDDLAERASPTVREFSARTAEFAADAAEKASPYLRRAGSATADASGKLASKSRSWAAEVRASMATTESHDINDTPGATKPDLHTPATEDAPDGPTPV